MTLRAAIYIRVSSEEQLDGYSLAAQELAARDFASVRQYQVVEVFEERGRSGKSALRPEFQRMILAAEAGAFDVIIVHKLDRFSRSLLDVMVYLNRLNTVGVSFVSASEQFDFTTPWGKVILAMLAAFAQWYLDNLSNEIKKGKAERARQGGWNGTLSWGYTTPGRLQKQLVEIAEEYKAGNFDEDEYSKRCQIIEDTLEQWEHKTATSAVPDPFNAQGVMMAFSAYSTGKYSDREIGELLNESGYRISSRGRLNLFGKETMADLLQNRFYIGETSYGGGIAGSSKRRKEVKYITGAHPALISRTLFEKCQHVRKERGRNQSRDMAHKKAFYPLTGLLICVDCGAHWSGWTLKGSRFYRRKKLKQNCMTVAHSRSAKSLENELFAFLVGIKLPEDWRERVLAQIDAAYQMTDEHKQERQRLEGQRDRLKKLYQYGDISDDEYERERGLIQRKLAEIDAMANIPGFEQYEQYVRLIRDIGNLWKKATLEDQRLLARQLVRKIYLDEGHIKAIEPTPVMWVLLKAVTYPVRGEQDSNLRSRNNPR